MGRITIIIWLAVLLVGWGLAQPVEAREGRIVLKNITVACEGISIWRDSYRIFGRCSGLVYPYQERIDQYILWIVPDGEEAPRRVDNVEVGFFDGRTDRSFSRVFITAEEDSSPRSPSDLVIASAEVQPFDFSPVAQLQPTPTPLAILIPTATPTSVAAVGANLRRLLTILAVGLGIFVAAIVVMVIISRRG